MSSLNREWVRLHLGKGCRCLYSMDTNEAGEILSPEGNLLKWAIRDGKPHELWACSITIAMSLAPVLKRPSEEIAHELAAYLCEQSPLSWTFTPLKGYINAYFQPKCLMDYMEAKEALDWSTLRSLKNGDYAYFRLQTILKSLKARGMGTNLEDFSGMPLEEHSLNSLFDYPATSLTHSSVERENWEKWLEEVAQMTRRGSLRNLDGKMEEVLYTFIKACLN